MRTPQRRTGVSAFRRTPLVAAVSMALAQGAMASTLLTVNTDVDGGPGSLRQAILDANFACYEMGDSSPIITFTGPFTISPSTPLPAFSCSGGFISYSPTIDAVNGVPGASPNTQGLGMDATLAVVIDGTSAANNFYGGCLTQYQDNGYGGMLTVKGVHARNFWTAYGGGTAFCGRLSLQGNRIEGNVTGVESASGSTIGGPAAADRNVIIGNEWDGIDFDGAVNIENNFIGTPDGATASPNDTGIYFSCCTQPSGNIIGNTIVSSGYAGIEVYYDAGMTISGNKINTDVLGNTLLGSSSYGISLYYSYGAQITDNVIAGTGNGIDDYNSGTVVPVLVSNNRIGVNNAGSSGLGNGTGIYLDSSANFNITGNTISGNSSYGLWLAGTSNMYVYGNMIGTDSGGTTNISNAVGIYIGLAPVTAQIDNNTISGNTSIGVYSSDANDVRITNNRIGTSLDNSRAIANGLGIVADCGERLDISGNTVSGNLGGGIALGAIQNSSIGGNYVGTNPSGAVLGNTGNGIWATHLTCGSIAYGLALSKSIVGGGANNESDSNNFNDNFIANNSGHGFFIEGGSNNTLVDNRIHGNSLDGIRVDVHCCDAYGGNLGAATGNSLVLNYAYGNGAKNVNLGFDGAPAPHQAYGADVSRRPNHWQNTPVIGSVTRDALAGTTTIAFDLESVAGVYRIDVYSNPSLGNPAGQSYVGSTSVTLPYGGNVSGSYSVNSLTLDNFSLMATRDVPTDSSEFSTMVAAATLPVPGVSVIPTSIDFGDTVVGRSSPSGTVTISSVGTGDYVINNLRDASCTGPAICSSGPFACSTSCVEGTPYRPSQSCSITATFNPTTTGPFGKTLYLCDNAAGSPRTITFAGNGINPPLVDIAVSPTSYYFGEVLVGNRSASSRFTVSNAGTNTVYLGSVTTTGDFSVTGSTCAPTLSGGASCSADVLFAPSARGFLNGTVTVTGSSTPPPAALVARGKVASAGTTTTVSAALSGNGLQFGDLRLPDAINFGTTVLHGPTLQQSVGLTNNGNGDLTLGSITVSGPFALTNPCPATLAPGQSCTLTVSFNPAALGSYTGTLTVVSDAPGGSRGIPLSAQVIAESRPVVTLSSDNLGFGDRTVGSPSASQRVTITNEGSQEATLGTVTAGGTGDSSTPEFRVASTTCGPTLAPQATCVADVVMQPLGFGPRTGLLTVPSNSLHNPATAALSGRGCRPFSVGANRSPRDPCEK